MKRSVHLYIGDIEAEFQNLPDVLYTFRVDDLTSPAAVKNSYSKTITLPSTKANNRIFGQYWAGDRTTGTGFDATRRTPFSLYVDNELYQTGYCKLNDITQNRNSLSYSVSLFGGLGEFFANLEYTENPAGNDDKRKMSDLDFYSDGNDTPLELGFEINKETVKSAWDDIDDTDSKWNVLNFAPAYNGLPQDFDADKVLMNVGVIQQSHVDANGRPYRRSGGRGSVVVTSVTEDGVTYQTYGGYALAELSREYTGAEMREFRSYLMRPVLSVRRAIEAICDSRNNGGYEVDLDSGWFTDDNCYFNDLWVTLPMLSTMDYNTKEVSSSATVTTTTKATGTTTTGDPGYYEDYLAVMSQSDSGMAYDVNVKLSLDIEGVTDNPYDDLVICAYSSVSHKYYASAIFVQLVAYDAAGNPVAGSPEYFITSSYGARRSGRTDTVAYFVPITAFTYNQPYGDDYTTARGSYFHRLSGTTYRWNEEISLTAQNVPAGSTLKVLVTKVYKTGGTENSPKYVFYRLTQAGQITQYSAYTFNNFNVTINSSRVAFKTNEGIRTGAAFTKNQLLDTDYSPAEFLLSYAKIFGLYFLQDPIKKKVSILTRKSFFLRDTLTDIEPYVDRQNARIEPLVFKNKWYSWNLEADESEYGKAYEDTYGKKYGQALINTDYNFNRDTTEVLTDNIFKNAVQVLERSNAFCYTGQDSTSKPWMFPGYSYLLYDTTDNTNTHEVTVNPSSTIDAFSGFTTGYMYYDLFDKVQLHSADNSPADGANVLLMRGANRTLSVGSQQLGYFITDDNSYMNILNQSRPCWLYTQNETDAMGNSLAIRVTECPYFSRYQIYDVSGYITRSLDFGRPEEIYIPNAIYRPGSTIYEEFWQSYISDLYSKDTHILRTKMLFKEKPNTDYLRRFYWLDGAIYRMVEISDYNVAKDALTDVVLVKVQDRANYTSVDVVSGSTLTLTLSSDSVGYSGGTVQYTISVSDGGDWVMDYHDSQTSVSATAGTGDYTGTWTIPANGGTSAVQRGMTVVAGEASARVYLTQAGVTLSLSGPLEQGDVDFTGGTRTFRLLCPDSNWSAKTDYTGIITNITPSQGNATDGSGVTITATLGRNSDASRRSAYIYVQTPNGGYQRSSNIIQNGAGNSYLTLSPDYVYQYPSMGGTIQVAVSSNRDWYCENYYPDVCYTTDTASTSGDTVITVTVNRNTGGSRFGSIYFRFVDAPANAAAVWTVSQASGTTAATFYLATTAGTVSYDSGVTTIQYAIDNVDEVYTQVSGASWITDVQTGITGATVTFDRNSTDDERTGWILFSVDNETWYAYELTQDYTLIPDATGTITYQQAIMRGNDQTVFVSFEPELGIRTISSSMGSISGATLVEPSTGTSLDVADDIYFYSSAGSSASGGTKVGEINLLNSFNTVSRTVPMYVAQGFSSSVLYQKNTFYMEYYETAVTFNLSASTFVSSGLSDFTGVEPILADAKYFVEYNGLLTDFTASTDPSYWADYRYSHTTAPKYNRYYRINPDVVWQRKGGKLRIILPQNNTALPIMYIFFIGQNGAPLLGRNDMFVVIHFANVSVGMKTLASVPESLMYSGGTVYPAEGVVLQYASDEGAPAVIRLSPWITVDTTNRTVTVQPNTTGNLRSYYYSDNKGFIAQEG